MKMYRSIIEELKTVPFSNKKYSFCYLIFISNTNSVWTSVLGFRLDSPKLVGINYIKEKIINNFNSYLTHFTKSLENFNHILNQLNNNPENFIEKYIISSSSRLICFLCIPPYLNDLIDEKIRCLYFL